MSFSGKTWILLFTLLIATTNPLPCSSSTNAEKVYSTNLYLLAVDGEGKGLVVKVDLNVYYPGRGNIVVVVEEGYVAEDTRMSIEYAVKIASMLSGVNYAFYDYEFVFPEKAELRGASATLAFVLGLLAFFTGNQPANRTGVTGIVSPNAMVGLVEGLTEKYSAGLEYGLDSIIGPPSQEMLGKTRYTAIIDVFSAYRLYTGNSLYHLMDINSSYASVLRKKLCTAFKSSYSFFRDKAYSIIARFREKASVYNGSLGYRYVILADKYAKGNKWYTAATYAFRSYIELYRLYLYELNRTGSLSILLEEEARLREEVKQELQRTKQLLDKAVQRVNNLWSLDALLNSYVRYTTALQMYREGEATEDLALRAEIYGLALARAYTAEHWLLITNITLSDTRTFSAVDYNIANSILRDALLSSIDYYHSLGILGESKREEYYSVVERAADTPTKLFINYTLQYHDLSLITEMLSPPIFSQFLSVDLIENLNRSFTEVVEHIYSLTGTLPPSTLTLAELTSTYMAENESLEVIGSLYARALSLLIPQLVLAQARSYIEVCEALCKEAVTVTTTLPLEGYAEIAVILAIVLIGVGSFLAGYSLKKHY